MSYWGYYPPYVPVAEKKARAAKKLKELSKKNPNLKPVILQGTKIARTWWGKAWNLNLERYADYDNRIGRGRSYVRHGAVLDLQIDSGVARALVQGSQSKPYSVVVSIKTLKKERWQTILSQCQGMLESLQELISGSFPKMLGEIFIHKDDGMFPHPKEITFNCSCPDWAGMCKHVAATLYGIGARLDESPELFFRMRNVEMGDLIQQAISGHKEKLLARAARKSSRVLEEVDLSSTFGIELQGSGRPIPGAFSDPSILASDAVSSMPRRTEKAVKSAKTKPPKRSSSLKSSKASLKVADKKTVRVKTKTGKSGAAKKKAAKRRKVL
ncbi:MAG: hypothetical protein M0Z48_08635 [Nitrospiraceae bacterium]|nr:hypothetical protein [Nitrospiraceae bacterium]